MGIKAKIMIPTIVLTLLVSAAILIANIILFSDYVDDTTANRVNSASQVAFHHLSYLETKATAASLGMAENRSVITAIKAGNRDRLLAYAEAVLEKNGGDFCTVADPAGQVILRTHDPENYGDSVTTQATIRAAMAGENMTAIEEGTAIRLSVRSATPVYDSTGAMVGVVSVGYRLDTDQYVDTIKEISGCEATVFLGGERISTTVLRTNGTRASGTLADIHISETVLAGNTYTGRADILGRAAVSHYAPISGPAGQVVGMMFVGQYVDEMASTMEAFLRSGVLIAVLLLAAFTVVILIIAGRIVTPICAMAKAATALADGDTDIDIRVNTRDEMRTLAEAFNRMILNTRRQVEMVKHIADGSLSVPVAARSDKDIMNRALAELNETIKTQAAAIQEEHGRFRLMLDATPLASRLWDRNYKMVECNEAAVKLFQLKDKQEYRDRFLELSPEYQPDGLTTRDKIRLSIDEAFENGSCTYEWRYRLLDGTPLPAEVTLVRMPYRGDYVVAAYSRDLREQEEMFAEIEQRDRLLKTALADAEEANRAKSDFLAQMSHEMRTPLNAIIGFSEIALEIGGLAEEAKTSLEKINNSGTTLLSIINDILDISKIHAGKFVILPNRYDVPSLINDAVLQNALRIGSRPIRFVLEVEADMPAYLYGDELRVRQIINNLLSNAIKYTEEGKVELALTWHVEEDAGWLTICVSDTGVGIRPENMALLFADYAQFGVTSGRQAGGSGLGLAITKSLVEMMDGTIEVTSQLGEGSVFTASIRQGYVNDTAIGSEVAKSLKSFQYSARKLDRNVQLSRIKMPYARVLVVDDNITNLDVARGFLKPYDIQVDCVTGGREAVEAIRAEKVRYHAVFMDHMMPEVDGIEAVRQIRAEIGTEYAQTVPIIALTANAVTGSEEMFLSNGFQAFLSKPIDLLRLDEVIRCFVRDKSQEEAEKQKANQVTKEAAEAAAEQMPEEQAAHPEGQAIAEKLNGQDNNSRPEVGAEGQTITGEPSEEYPVGRQTTAEKEPETALRESSAKTTETALKNTAVKGMDKGRALKRFGSESTLIDVLRTYAASTRSLLGNLQDYLAAGDLVDYTIAVQGIKGASYSIFAGETGRAAETLEFAVKAGDMAAVARGQAAFAAAADGLLTEIERLLVAVDNEKKKAPEGVDFTAPAAEILIVEDNETNLKAVMGLLRPLKMQVDAAENGKVALEKILTKQYHLIFMDHMMPVMDGIEAVSRLREMEGVYYQTVPVIALTANEREDDRESFRQAGMNDLIRKPVERKEIYAAVRHFLPGELVRPAVDESPAGVAPQGKADGQEERASSENTDLPEIAGIDTRAGIRYSGTKELFISLLGDFYRLIDMKATKIEKCLADGLIRDVTIEVHALKSTARMIGAGELAEEFYRLEQYGNEGNAQALAQEWPAIREHYRSYKPVLQPFGEVAEQEKRAASEAELLKLLKEISEAMDRFELNRADEAFTQLEQLRIPEECRERMELLRAYMADVSIEEVIQVVGEMMGVIEEKREASGEG